MERVLPPVRLRPSLKTDPVYHATPIVPPVPDPDSTNVPLVVPTDPCSTLVDAFWHAPRGRSSIAVMEEMGDAPIVTAAVRPVPAQVSINASVAHREVFSNRENAYLPTVLVEPRPLTRWGYVSNHWFTSHLLPAHPRALYRPSLASQTLYPLQARN